VDHSAISEQVLVEHKILAHIVNALRASIDWNHRGTDLTRKIGSLRFVSQSLQRHLKHLTGLEEEDGYMSVVVESHPGLQDEVAALRQEHVHFRTGLNRILNRLKKARPDDHATVAAISEDILALLEKLDAHSHKETGLIQHASFTDEGGEG
jgi:hemerythrin-like domain-containing protein